MAGHAGSFALLALTAFIAGTMNAVAGGGSFLTFPVLVLTGVPSIIANATNTVALFPASLSAAWAFRRDLRDFDGVSVKSMLVMSLIGGALGALLLLSTDQHVFDTVVPWLLLAASLAFTFGPRLAKYHPVRAGRAALLMIQFGLTVYGGYFGAAIGIMLLAAWSLLGRTDLNAMNAAKNIFVGCLNLVATLCFVAAGKVWWPQALTMMAAAIVGGYTGARIARRVDPRWIRAFIVGVSFTITAAFFLRQWG
jgi:uncharacterized membrane protein YfcA